MGITTKEQSGSYGLTDLHHLQLQDSTLQVVIKALETDTPVDTTTWSRESQQLWLSMISFAPKRGYFV
uniref:Uncharacterized protein n=1 Tax=Arion vulgaris TaxID=1028688 RepID=A0A0B7BR39_9EUPU